ncbi:MAG TPA: hypothetical protein VG821_12035 [Rhizomicrobium sp.]|nr:hypothetical protein [Rhizomicrobium sp.]
MIALLRETITVSTRFLAGKILSILRRALVPAAVGCVMLYVLLNGYCIELLNYLSHPSDVMASRVLGIAAAGGLVLLLLDAVIVAALTRLVLQERVPEPSFLGIGVTAWRIYTAYLRLLLAVGGGGVVLWLALLALHRVGLSPDPGIVRIVCFLVIYWLGVRTWFLVPPIAARGGPDGSLTASWRRSSGHVLPIAVVLFALLLGGIAFQAAGEFLLRGLGVLSLPRPVSFRDAVEIYRRNLLPMTLLTIVSYLFVTTLLAAARVHLYRRLAGVSAGA